MTDELMKSLEAATKLQRVRALVFTVPSKKRTRAMIARERGLEPLADMIINDTVTLWRSVRDCKRIHNRRGSYARGCHTRCF